MAAEFLVRVRSVQAMQRSVLVMPFRCLDAALLIAIVGFVSGCSRSDKTEQPKPIVVSTPDVAGNSGQAEAPKSDDQATETSHDDPKPIKEEPPIDPMVAAELASSALANEQFETAYQQARIAYRQAPEDPSVMFVMARVLGQRQRYPEAIGLLDKVVSKDPQATLPALGQSSEWLIQDGQWGEAEKRLLKILQMVPSVAMVQRELGKLYLREGRRFEAAKYLRSLCQQGELSVKNLRSLIRLALELKGEPPTEAYEPIGRLGVARRQAVERGYQEALKVLDGPVLNRLVLADREAGLRGRLLAYQKDAERLEAWAAEFSESINPKAFPDALFARGHWHYQNERWEKSIADFKSVVLADQTDAEAYFMLATLFEQLDDEAKANAFKQRAELIVETRRQAESTVGPEGIQIAAIDSLASTLRELHRVDEALAWQALKIAYDQQLSKDERQSAMESVNQARLQFLKTSQSEPSRSFILCEIED